MGKVLFVLELPEPKMRKDHAPPSKRHRDATKYSRKQKHKARRDEAPGDSGASFLLGRQSRTGGLQKFFLQLLGK